MVQVIIMAGGEGKRMKSALPKVLVLFKNKPMIIHVLEQAFLLKPIQILIVVGKKSGIQIQETIEKWNSNKNINIKYVLQDPPLGTGHAVKSCVNYLENDNKTIILSGDVPNISSLTLKESFKLDSSQDLVYSQILGFIPESNFGYGRIISDDEDLLYICEEKECTEELKKIKLCNSGIYCMPSNVIKNYIQNIENNNNTGEYYLPDIFNSVLEDMPKSVKISVLPCIKNKEVLGVNTLEQLKSLEDIEYEKIEKR